ncbi:MFS transporter [Streptomyces sp. SID3343]|uniref:MFS transporter n=1 Tax=Streptomyces sp. SID3343 TaxID=2690260 RepID=UPI00136ECE9A|nr:MFS transporter [Streptomyces sp. SID3343]MYV97720.1 hypothetical protein [Streptomyces sp. SID3343]
MGRIAAVILGVGQGAGFAVAPSLIGLRTGDGAQTSALSSMAQDRFSDRHGRPAGRGPAPRATDGRTVPPTALSAVCAIQAAAALVAGRTRQVRVDAP